MKLAVGSDKQTHLTDSVLQVLGKHGHEVELYGPLAGHTEYWPTVAEQVAERVATSEVTEGILFCWTGTGVSIAANKVRGIRAALCNDPETARGARLWNNANILCMSLRRTSEIVAEEIIDTWFRTAYQPNEEDDMCLEQVAALDNYNSHP